MAFASWDHNSHTCSAEMKYLRDSTWGFEMHNPARMVPAHAHRLPLLMVAAPVLAVLCYLQPHQVVQPLYDKSQVEGSGHVEEVRGLPMTFSTVTMPTLPSPHGQSNHLPFLQLLIPWSYLEGDGISSAKLIPFQNVKSGRSFHYVIRISETAIHTHILCSICIVNALLRQGRKHLNLG